MLPEAPATTDQVIARYQSLRSHQQTARETTVTQRSRLGYAMLAVVAVIILLTTHATQAPAWAFLLSFAALAILIPRHLGLQAKVAVADRTIALYNRNLARMEGTETQPITPSDHLADSHHLYQHDLNLLGPHSLFDLLDTVRTGVGQRGLADLLQRPATWQQSVARQQAVQELTPLTDLREQIALLGTSKFQQVHSTLFDQWLEEPTPNFSKAWRPLLVLTSLALVILLLLGLTHVRDWTTLLPNLALAAAIQVGISLFLHARVKPILTTVTRLSNHVQMFSQGLALLDRQTFTSPLLLEIQSAARQPSNGAKLLNQLQNQITIAQQRTKEIFYVFSLLLAAGTQASITIAAWKSANGEAMRNWLDAWARFEALSAVANHAFEHPEDSWPELLPPAHTPTLEAVALAHPLLPNAVANDIAFAPQSRFYLISGSNMSGKSTLMRSVGINAVLAYAGAPVRARSMRLTPLTLGASLALTDSLAEGKSKFLAEVERLQQIVEASKHAPVLFLVDEIFSGTNSVDRHAAAAAVLRSLLNNGAIGALSTHDLALAELANPQNTGQNVHMASPNPADPLGFDYLLKPGVNTSSNALAIIRMMGLEA